MFCIHSENDMFCLIYLKRLYGILNYFWTFFLIYFSFVFKSGCARHLTLCRTCFAYKQRFEYSRVSCRFQMFLKFFSRFFHLSPSLKVRSFFGAEGGWGRFPSLFLQENEASMYPHWKERSLDGRGISTRLPFSMKVAN